MAHTLSDSLAYLTFLGSGAPAGAAHTQAPVYYTRAHVEAAALDDAGHLYPLLRVPAWARPIAAWYTTTTPFQGPIAGATNCQIGLYESGDWSVDQAVIDADCIVAAGFDISGSHIEAPVTLATSGFFHEIGNVSPQPDFDGTTYDVVLELIAEATGAGIFEFGLLYAHTFIVLS